MAKRRTAQAAVAESVVPTEPRWLTVTYEPVSLFSLRSTYSMSKGGKTLLLPTPYAVKMALIDAVFRLEASGTATAAARRMFDLVKNRRIRFKPPRECVVQNTFVKIRQEERGGDAGQYVPTIAYRELVYYLGCLDIAIDVRGLSDDSVKSLVDAASHINYFGKRGSFFQFLRSQEHSELTPGYSIADSDRTVSFVLGHYGVTQFLDDFGPDLCRDKDGFERISTFHDKKIEHGKHRILVSTLVPYRRVEATRSFTRYVTQGPIDRDQGK